MFTTGILFKNSMKAEPAQLNLYYIDYSAVSGKSYELVLNI